MPVKKAPATERRQSAAVEAYERAVKALGKKDYEKARELLESLITTHPEERDILDRARSYKALCDRALEKRPAYRPKSFEDMLSYGVYLHNRGEYAEALKVLHQAAEIHPKNEHVLYCIAAAAARHGDTATALKALKGAITQNPGNRVQARVDPDFESLRDEDDFLALLSAAEE